MAAVLILLLYVFFLMRTSYCYADPVQIMGKLKGSLLGSFFLIYLIMTGVYILSLIEQIVPVWAVSGIATGWLIFWAVVVCAYGADHGMQRRGRMAGVSGGIFLFVIILMLLLCIGQGNAEYLKEMLRESRLWGKEIVYSTYDVVCAFSGISLLPFVLQNVEKRGNSGKTVTSAILTVSGILLLILFILPSVLGWGRIQKELYPVLPLMAGADLPGNVLARFDVLWIGFLLYGLFFALGSCFHYGIRILDTVHLRSGKYWLPIVIYAFSFVRIDDRGIADFYKMYLGTFFVPGLVLIQTFKPENPLLQLLIQQGYAAFADTCLAERKAMLLPPYRYCALIRAETPQAEKSLQFLQHVVGLLFSQPDAGQLEIWGPVPAPMERRAGVFRAHVLIFCKDRRLLHHLLGEWWQQVGKLPERRGVRCSIDIDAQELS